MTNTIYIKYFDYTKHKNIFIYDLTKIHYTYKITNKINLNFYMGKHTHDIQSNKKDNYYGSGELIIKAIKKYNIENFDKEILAYYRSANCALIGESKILTKDVVKLPNCYNMKPGGQGGSVKGRKMSEESIIKRTKSQKGLKRSTETCARLSKAKKGHIKSEETRKKLSDASSGKNNPNYGKCRSEETKRKISDSQSGELGYWYNKEFDIEHTNKISNSLKEFYKHNDNKNAIKPIINDVIYKSLTDASKELGISRKVITTRCRSDKIKWADWLVSY